ncbi:MAG TPA: DNA repair protein RecN [Syntrophales bacterium]|nr:DNA repair protein RecN [Syntrophales bacterium]
MLRELSISNFAIIDRLSVSFGEGLNVISGETGAGKSILIGAISLLLGDRAYADMIRSDEDAAVVEAFFEVGCDDLLGEKLQEMGFGGAKEVVVRRIVSRSGRNRAYINGGLANLAMLSSLSARLVNICGQHEHQAILDSAGHVDILDAFGGLGPLRSAYAARYGEFRERGRILGELEEKNRRRAEREELLRFQRQEISAAEPKPDEDRHLLDEKKVLSNIQKLRDLGTGAYEGLYGKGGSVLGELRGVIASLREIRKVDAACDLAPEEAEALFYQLEEIAFALRRYLDKLSADPERLEAVEERLAVLGQLKRKYGPSLEDVLRCRKEMEEDLEGIASADETIGGLRREIAGLQDRLLAQAADLSRERKKAAKALKKAMEREIAQLNMAAARFEAFFPDPALGPEGVPVLGDKGIDAPEFLLSANTGEALKPMSRIASGGELSRIILAVKKVLARTGSVGTVVFDEVDSGIGGSTAEVVGRKLKDVAKHHQVLCITHLPQIACYGDLHYRVSKAVKDGRTATQVERLSDDARLEEIARMLGGIEVTEATRRHAREMLAKAQEAETTEDRLGTTC